MTLYDTIREDICNVLPDEITDLMPPYLENMTFDQKFQTTYISLKRTIRLKSRLLSLTNAYYLGKLLNSLITSQRYEYNRLLTPHYQVMAENTFDLFECHSRQITGTTYVTVQQLRMLSRPDVLSLRNILVEHFAGALN